VIRLKLYLKNFRLVGFEKNYEIIFKKGLNFISGPTSTGKTTIFELIDYAFGAKSHKSYIEVGTKCSDVEIEFYIKDTLYRIKRTLFKFELPILVEIFDDKNQTFEIYGTYLADNKDYKKSLSSFLLSKLGLDGVKVSNQNFSFRDLFKFSYLKQTEIDNEDILSEKNWPIHNKQRATFEIIFNFYDQLIGELKSQLKTKQDEYKDQKIQYEGIQDFLNHSNVENYDSVSQRKNENSNQIQKLNELLEQKKKQIGKDASGTMARELSENVIKKKNNLKNIMSEILNQEQYIQKLVTLSNQYSHDLEKLDAAIMGVQEINKYDFQLCPNCLQPIETHTNKINCSLCGNSMEKLAEQILVLKSEKRNISTKRNELEKHILQELTLREYFNERHKVTSKEIEQDERLLTKLTEAYVNPHIEEISFINLNLGKLYSENDELDNSLRFIRELNRLSLVLKEKLNEIENLKDQIDNQHVMNEKHTIFDSLNKKFTDILTQFHFPKLEKAYIDFNKYLPYVRGRKYNDLGSLGAVTLITMAYYLAILEESTTNNLNSNHLNLLMIDTPRKNLGISSQTSEFQDEEIYESIISYFIELDNSISEKIQLIVINNGYPEFLPQTCLVQEFSSNGTTGLIDDI